MQLEERITTLTLVPKDEPLFSELSTTVTIVDESGGEFVCIKQDDREIRVDPPEWPVLRAAIDKMIAACRDQQSVQAE